MVAIHKATEEPMVIMSSPLDLPLEASGPMGGATTAHVLVQRGMPSVNGGMESYHYEYQPVSSLESPEAKATRNVDFFEFMEGLRTQAQNKKAAIDSTANVN